MPRRKSRRRSTGAVVSLRTSHCYRAASAGSAVLERVDFGIRDEQLAEKFVVVDVERAVRLERAEDSVEGALAALIGGESGFEPELRFRDELLDVQVDLLDRLVARCERFAERGGKLLSENSNLRACRVAPCDGFSDARRDRRLAHRQLDAAGDAEHVLLFGPHAVRRLDAEVGL